MNKVYRGSSRSDIEVFEPTEVVATDDFGKLHKAGIEAKKVVWLTRQKFYALPFAMFNGKLRFGVFFNEDRPRISFTSIDAKDQIDLDQKFYLYELEDGDYIQVNPVEYISLEPVKVLTMEEFTAREILQSYDVYLPQKWEII